MAGNSFGKLFRLTTFGESHGPAIGGVIDGCPAGLKVDMGQVQVELGRRRPGSTSLGTARIEMDQVEWLSGFMQQTTLGTPIGFIIRNQDARSEDYDMLKDIYRPAHADLTWEQKYGIRDHRGGGRSSARETASRVVAGAVARQLLARTGVEVSAFVSQVADMHLKKELPSLDLGQRWDNDVRCPDPGTAAQMQDLIEKARDEKDSVGGVITLWVEGLAAGLGEPVFDKLHADLGKALLSINAAKGVEVGAGFAATTMRGSAHNDEIISKSKGVGTKTNRSGGVLGGISNGEDIIMRVGFKPVATIGKGQQTVDKAGNAVELAAAGRHDPCVLPRAVPIVEAMACLVLADHQLRNRASRI